MLYILAVYYHYSSFKPIEDCDLQQAARVVSLQ